MAKPFFLVKVLELEVSARFILRFPRLIVLLFVVLCSASFSYTIQNLGIRNNTAELLSQYLPFQQVRLKLEKAFPLEAAAIIIVIESETPEHTAMAADHVRQRLQGQPGYFDSAYIPDDNPFFRQQGFLYLDLDELEDLSDRLTDAQPFIGHLSQNYHVAGLVDIISLALEAEDKASSLPLEPLLSAIDRTLIKVKSKQIHFLSWQQLLTENSFGRDQTQRLVIAKPHLDFNALMPAQKPMAYLRGLADEMTAEFPGVNLSFTGEVALEHEEMETVNQDMMISGIVSLFLVCAALWLGLRSFRLLIATFVALIAGLILTAGFATLAIGHLNLISVAFAVLYIGLGVDFATHLCLNYQESRQAGHGGECGHTEQHEYGRTIPVPLRADDRDRFFCVYSDRFQGCIRIRYYLRSRHVHWPGSLLEPAPGHVEDHAGSTSAFKESSGTSGLGLFFPVSTCQSHPHRRPDAGRTSRFNTHPTDFRRRLGQFARP